MLSPRQRNASLFLYILGVISGLTVSYFMLETRISCEAEPGSPRIAKSEKERDSGIVFIGGHPRSGTTLMRVLLDAHPSFHCGQETHIIPDILTLRRKYSRGRGLNRLREAGVDLARSFPTAQFILMLRDARAVLHSIRRNKIRISHFPRKVSEGLHRWNKVLEIMFQGCLSVGAERCKVVHYERLVLKPRLVLREILRFLRTPWSESVLNHTRYLDKTGGILLSRLERSTHQVRKPIYNESLHLWMTSSSLNIPSEELLTWAPMMDTLGYIDVGNPPNYLNLKRP